MATESKSNKTVPENRNIAINVGTIKEDMTSSQISEIISDRLIAILKIQFENTKRTFLDNQINRV